jgi:hypothetical protein
MKRSMSSFGRVRVVSLAGLSALAIALALGAAAGCAGKVTSGNQTGGQSGSQNGGAAGGGTTGSGGGTSGGSTSGGTTGSSGGGGGSSGSNCIVTCEGPDNIDGGIGCGCNVTCNGIVYELQCVCGECTCYQDGVAGKTTSASVSACDFGAMSLMPTYFNTCGYPGAKNAGGGGGPTSNDAGGKCP